MANVLARNVALAEEGNTFRIMPILELNAPNWNERSNSKINEGEALSIQVRIRAVRFSMINEELYRQSYRGPYLKCPTPGEGRNPQMMKEAENYGRSYDKCQRFTHQTRVPPGKTKSVLSTWSFWHWGIDIVGIPPTTPSRKRYALVATDYFTK
ncbi:hypothetical protein TIFTF001_028446 [Ficus carica]|uniref:Uncharacterized protein n=1 Tax=Ficus carica TaxID=3494 RepID=A0AA88J1R8_FICCA|nr:hypothetical protein TIFTF001_028446 [Ficus carica]